MSVCRQTRSSAFTASGLSPMLSVQEDSTHWTMAVGSMNLEPRTPQREKAVAEQRRRTSLTCAPSDIDDGLVLRLALCSSPEL